MSEPSISSPTTPVSGIIVPGFGDGENENALATEKSKAWHYFKTIPGILKIISVVLGLFSLSFILYGYITAELFSVTEKICDVGKDETCDNYYRYEICKKKRNSSRLPVSRIFNETLKCPSKWLVTPPLCVFGLVWITTLIFLISFLWVNLSKYRSFLKADLLGHTIAGILTVFSASIVLCFVMQVKSDDMCNMEHLRVEFVEAWTNNSTKYLGIRLSRRHPNFTEILNEILPKCEEIEKKTYLQGHFLAGGLLAFITGILYGAIGTVSILNGKPTDIGEDEMEKRTQKISLLKEILSHGKIGDSDPPQQSPAMNSEGSA